MTIESINPADIPMWAHPGRPPTELTVAMCNLLVDEAIKLPCHWGHSNTTNGCGGSAMAWQVGKRNEKKFATRCKDKILYVHRIA
jgi:hypothetical protein